MNNRRLIISSTISILLVSILLIGSTYSIFTSTEIDEKENVYTTGFLDITYTLSEDNIMMEDATPTSIENSMEIKPYRITVTNNGNVAYKFNIILNDTTASNKIDYQYIMTQVGKIEPRLLSDCTDNILKSDITILPNTSVDIDIRVWLSTEVKNSEMGKSFYGKLAVDGLAINTDEVEIDNSNLIAELSLYSTIKQNAILDTNIDFSQISSDTNGKGLYIKSGTENEDNPIYYYRGAVEDNNVIFADMCFKIVRTTETGGTKLIYNGLPTNGQCIATGADVLISEMSFNDKVDISVSAAQPLTDAGYMYGTQYYFGNSTKSENFLYGSDVKYENGEYSLIGTTQMQYNVNTKYTCASTGDTCEKVWYIFGSLSSGRTYYIELINGKKIKDAISDMLDYNINSSAIKGNKDAEGSVDNWYYKNIEQKGYSKYVEDTVWCQDRSIPSLGGWDQTSTVESGHLHFDVYNRVQNRQPSLECIREVDKFTVSKENGNGDLDYPVGLLTADEVMLAGAVRSAVNDTFYLSNSEDWWLISSRGYHGIGYGAVSAFASGYYSVFTAQTTLVSGVRPAIALNSKVKIKEGNGTKEEPYIVMY